MKKILDGFSYRGGFGPYDDWYTILFWVGVVVIIGGLIKMLA